MEDESIVITDKSGNEIHLDTTGSNITITAPETMTLNAKTLNINVAENMTTNVGMNANETVGMNKTTSVGMLNMISVGTDFITNVVGKMVEFITGNKESHTEKDRMRSVSGNINIQSNGTIEQHAKKEVQNNSGENSKNH